MRVSHSVSAVCDDPNLVSAAGLAPVLALAGLHELVADHLTVPGSVAGCPIRTGLNVRSDGVLLNDLL